MAFISVWSLFIYFLFSPYPYIFYLHLVLTFLQIPWILSSVLWLQIRKKKSKEHLPLNAMYLCQRRQCTRIHFLSSVIVTLLLDRFFLYKIKGTTEIEIKILKWFLTWLSYNLFLKVNRVILESSKSIDNKNT